MPLPIFLQNLLRNWRDRAGLLRAAPIACDTTALRASDPKWIAAALEDRSVTAEWPEVAAEIGTHGITAAAGGVNPGDRRAIYHLIRALKPKHVLEVGTHIGASTIHIAAALRANGRGDLTSVDLMAVNDEVTRPWIGYGAKYSPAELMDKVGMADRVRFVTSPSLRYLSEAAEKFDLIFLDGDHSAATVYRELPAATQRLHPDGVILLHDFFPDGRSLWSNGVIIPGPWLGARRLQREGARLTVLPLGALPWPTKLGSNVTSLAIAARSA